MAHPVSLSCRDHAGTLWADSVGTGSSRGLGMTSLGFVGLHGSDLKWGRACWIIAVLASRKLISSTVTVCSPQARSFTTWSCHMLFSRRCCRMGPRVTEGKVSGSWSPARIFHYCDLTSETGEHMSCRQSLPAILERSGSFIFSPLFHVALSLTATSRVALVLPAPLSYGA